MFNKPFDAFLGEIQNKQTRIDVERAFDNLDAIRAWLKQSGLKHTAADVIRLAEFLKDSLPKR
jgi:hypothetical protein